MAQEGFKRKLSAILSADVEGYSRLMGEDEEATVRTITAYREVLTTLIWSSKNGHPVKRLLPKENYSQKHLDFCIPKTNGDGDYYKTFRYI